MCRNIKPLFNFDPPATNAEISAAALQFVRKISGFTKPSKVNERAFEKAVRNVSRVALRLLDDLTTNAPARNREAESEKVRARMRKRFGEAVHAHQPIRSTEKTRSRNIP